MKIVSSLGFSKWKDNLKTIPVVKEHFTGDLMARAFFCYGRIGDVLCFTFLSFTIQWWGKVKICGCNHGKNKDLRYDIARWDAG